MQSYPNRDVILTVATHMRAALGQTNADRPDGQYALVAGLYVAILIAPAVVLGFSHVIADAAILYIGFLGTVTQRFGML